MRRTRRQLATALARRVSYELLGAPDRAGGDAGPDTGPSQVSERYHGLDVDLFVRVGQDLLCLTACANHVAGTGCPPHSERIPTDQRFERIVAFQENDQHLIRCCGVGRSPRSSYDTISFG